MITYTIEDKIEEALKTVLVNSGILTPIYITFDERVKDKNYISILCNSGNIELASGEVTGNWSGLDIEISVNTDYKKTTKAVHSEIVAKVREILFKDTLADDINNLESGVFVHMINPTDSSREIDGDTRITNTLVQAEEIFINEITD